MPPQQLKGRKRRGRGRRRSESDHPPASASSKLLEPSEKRGNHSLRAILDGSPAPPHPKSSAAEGSRGLSGEEEREGELRASIRSGGGSQVRRACSGGRIAGGRRRERERRRRWRGGGIFGGLDSDTLLLCSCSSTAAWAVGSQNHTI